MTVVFALIALGMVVVVVLTTGIALHSIRAIRMQHAFAKHPHARRWRSKPLITVTTEDGEPTRHIVALRPQYRKLVSNRENTDTDFLLWLPARTVLNPHDLPSSVRQFSYDPTLYSTPLLPVISTPQSLSEFLHAYSLIIGAPLAQARAGLFVDPVRSFPYIVNQSVSAPPYRTQLYAIYGWLFGVIALLVFLFAFHMAIVMNRPELLLAYLCGFSLWCAWAIGRYPYLALHTKILFILLFPTSLGYFLYRLFVAPVRFDLAALARHSSMKQVE
jgi:hypothetical protein